MVFKWFFWVLAAYLLGSVPFGKLISKRVAHIDITKRGSGNIGATNVAREIGIKWGLLTLLLDVLKGFIPVILFARYVSQAAPGHEIGLSAVGLSALLGHQFSFFLRFRGGKGVGPALGIYLAISPLSALLALLFFILIVYKWDFVSLGSIISVAAVPILLAIFGKPLPVFIGAVIAATLICLKHRENIQRLVNGQEIKWRDRGSQASSSKRRSNSSSE